VVAVLGVEEIKGLGFLIRSSPVQIPVEKADEEREVVVCCESGASW
jgi:hypothetical protein